MHLPVLKVDSCEYAFPIWKFRIVKSIEKTGLKLDGCGIVTIVKELPQGYYLPPFSLSGKTVLDLGATCGEVAWYYLKHGAKKVICVECDSNRVKLLKENQRNLSMNIDVVAEPFRSEHLSLPHDFIKCDIEGYEMELLPYAESLKPCILEAHTGWVIEQFEKHGFHKITGSSREVSGVRFCMMTNIPSKN
jgi:hypothetical protein